MLLDGVGDHRLSLELMRWLVNPDIDRIDLAVSFIMRSGLEVIAGHLEAALQRGASIRIITTDYLAITDPDALTWLIDLADQPNPNEGRLLVKVFHDPKVSFHPKAYIFRSSTGGAAGGFVGSSNLSRSGIDGGMEWNVGVDQVKPLVDSFERLWNHSHCVDLNPRWLADYRKRRPPANVPPDSPEAAVPNEPPRQPVTPWPIQTEALEALEQARIKGFRRGMVVMATGLGKTLLAALDSNRPEFRRVLFIAHREEILRQSRDAFRQVRTDGSFGFFTGQDKQPEADVVFAGIQTLHRHLHRFDANRFDYVVVDEFHHASAPTYRRAIARFDPKFLIGLTATPERRNGADLLSLCSNNLVFECGLDEGIRRGNLSPFHYWGIKDVADYAPIPWRNGRFDPEALAGAIETQDRAEQSLSEWRQKATGPTLAFCSSIAHAEFMADFFNRRGVPSHTVHSGPRSYPRQVAVEELQSGTVKVLFTVDVFNEGVDVPEISTVLILRPTDSPVVFLQQLGRGLRTSKGKEALQVIDLVGNHHSFLMKPRLLWGMGSAETNPSKMAVLQAIETGEFELPPGCSAAFELEAVDLLRRLWDTRTGRGHSVAHDQTEALADFCRNYADEYGERPSAAQTSRTVDFDLKPGHKSIADAAGWHRYLHQQDLLSASEQAATDELGNVLRGLEQESITKSYKLVALRALIELGGTTAPVPVAEVAARSLSAIRQDHRLRADIQIKEIPDLDNVSAKRWRDYWLKWPLQHMTNKSGSLFRIDPGDADTGGMIAPTFSVPSEHRGVFDELATEIVEWRLQDYLLGSKANPEPKALPSTTAQPHSEQQARPAQGSSA